MKLLVAALILSSVSSSPKKPTPKFTETFDQQYMAQVDKTNAALRTFANTPCTAPEFRDAVDKFKENTALLGGLYRAIPEGQDDIVFAKEVELYIGFLSVAQESVDRQNQCIKENKPKTPPIVRQAILGDK
jgi:hypothetical protein